VARDAGLLRFIRNDSRRLDARCAHADLAEYLRRVLALARRYAFGAFVQGTVHPNRGGMCL
jgi:hypothetical protein